MSGPPLPPRPPQQSGFQGNWQSGLLPNSPRFQAPLDPGNYMVPFVGYNVNQQGAHGQAIGNQGTMLKRQTSSSKGMPGSAATLSRKEDSSIRTNLRRCDSQVAAKPSRPTVTIRNSAKSSYSGLTDLEIVSQADCTSHDDAPPLPNRGGRPPLPAPNKTNKNTGMVTNRSFVNESSVAVAATLKPNRSDSNFFMNSAWNDIPYEQPPLPPPTVTRMSLLPESDELPPFKTQIVKSARFVFRTPNDFPPPRPFISETKTYPSRRNRPTHPQQPDSQAISVRR